MSKKSIPYKLYPIFLYVSFIYMGIVSAIFDDASYRMKQIGETFQGIGGILFITGLIMMFILQYRIWKWIIKRSYKNNIEPSIKTPGQAVGFQFIPLFNIYWIYKSVGLMAKNLNAVLEKEGSKDRASEALNIVILVFLYLGIIPFIGAIPAMINLLILYPIFFIGCARKINRNIN